MNLKIIHKKDEDFPKNFLKLKDCPEFIFVLGDEKILNEFSIAIVGARKASYESKQIARSISKEIASTESIVVSGLAIGIDSEAHKGALEVRGKTIAVLGNGLDKIYPRENTKLALQIINNGGAIISEYFPGTDPMPINLNRRNRLISALSEGVIIIEAKQKSGSLITAEYAIKQDKKLFVVPGGVNDENFGGSNQLLVDGARCVRNAQDVLKAFNQKLKPCDRQTTSKIVPENLKPIYKVITKSGVTLHQICEKIKAPTQEIFAKLTMLEISGCIRKSDGKFFKS